jgi:pimeloyl-ACP methyl ester carboxylesterase
MSLSQLQLPDGRRLDVYVSGAEGATPVVMHNGTPGAHRLNPEIENGAHAAGLRLVSISRPGYGDSTRLPGRTAADLATDVAAVLDWLGSDTAVTCGGSGGGPYAMACAAVLSPRITAVSVVASPGPFGVADLDFFAGMDAETEEEFRLAIEGEGALRPWLEKEAAELQGDDPLAALIPDTERAKLSPETAEALLRMVTEAVRTGVDGWLDDDLAAVQPWGFDLTAVEVPTFLWHGTEDPMIPVSHARWLTERVQRGSSRLVDGAGHLVGRGRWAEIFDELAQSS